MVLRGRRSDDGLMVYLIGQRCLPFLLAAALYNRCLLSAFEALILMATCIAVLNRSRLSSTDARIIRVRMETAKMGHAMSFLLAGRITIFVEVVV